MDKMHTRAEVIDDAATPNPAPVGPGRKPVATLERVMWAVAELERENLYVGIRPVMRVIGGSPETIKNHLKQLGYPAPIIESTPNLPESLLKVWKSSVHEHTKTVRTECDELLGEMGEQLMIKNSELLDREAELIQKDDLIALLRKERDEAVGARLSETQAHERTRAERDALRQRAERAEIAVVRLENERDTAIESVLSADAKCEKANIDLHRVEQALVKQHIENANLKGLLDSRMQGFEDGGGDAFPPDANGKGFPDENASL